MSIEKEREFFDGWIGTHPDYLDLTDYEKNIMFNAWFASRNRDGYKLVPIEPSEKILNAISREINKPNFGRICRSDLYKAMIGACDD